MAYNKKHTPTFHLLDASRNLPSIANLPPALTINNTTVYPSFRYKGGDATSTTWKPWGYPQSELGLLYLQAGAAPTYNAGSPLLGKHDDSVLGNNGGYYSAKTKEFADVAEEDLVFEIVGKMNAGIDTTVLFGKIDGAVTGYCIQKVANVLWVVLYKAAGAYNTVTAAINAYSWFHVIGFFNRDENSVNGGLCYLNGVAGTGVNPSACGSITNTQPFDLGAYTAGGPAQQFTSNIAYIAMWKRDSWHQAGAAGPTEWATIAAQRFALLNASRPLVSKAGDTYPVVQGSTSSTYQEKILDSGVRRIYQVGASYPRVNEVLDAKGRKIVGTLVEPAATNYVIQSHTFNVSWTPVRSTVAVTSVVCPDGVARTTNTLKEDATAANDHGIYVQTVTTTGLTYCFSLFVKAVNRTWVRLHYYDDDVRSAYFNLSTGQVGSVSGVTSNMKYWGNGWYRCWIVRTVTAANFYVECYVAEKDNDVIFDGLNQDSLYIFGAQAELGSYPSSYIPTTAAAVTRVADSCYYNVDSNIINTTEGAIKLKFLQPTVVSTAAALFDLVDAAGTQSYKLYVGADNVLYAYYLPDSTSTTIGTYSDNKLHEVLYTWNANKILDVWVDGVKTTMTVTTPAVGSQLTRLYVADSILGNAAGSIVVSDVRVYDKYIADWKNVKY